HGLGHETRARARARARGAADSPRAGRGARAPRPSGAMRKVVIHRPGGHGRLEIETHPDPVPGPGEVAVDVAAAGVNFADVAVRMGVYESAKKYVGWPITPGFELAGRVRAVGAGVTDVDVGQAVLGITRFGGYASSISVPRHQVFEL